MLHEPVHVLYVYITNVLDSIFTCTMLVYETKDFHLKTTEVSTCAKKYFVFLCFFQKYSVLSNIIIIPRRIKMSERFIN